MTRSRPNLLYLFGDEHRAHALGRNNPEVQSPVIDSLAAEGLCFTNAIANTPVCTPMRGTLLTGLWSLRHGAVSNDLPVRTGPEIPSIARSLGAEGYRCGYIGKWHIGGWPRDRFTPPGPGRLGFDDLWMSWECHHEYMRPKYQLNDDPTSIILEGQYEPEVQTDVALDWLAQHLDRNAAQAADATAEPSAGKADQDNQAPFCLFISYGPPHSPYRPIPPGTERLYDPASVTLRPNCTESERERRDLADYYAHVTGLDRQIGRLIALLRERGVLDDTLIVYSSDHGTMLGSHDHHNKQQPWEESANVPLVMRFGDRIPADTRGTRTDLLIGVLDYAPTLLGLLGVPVPDVMQGRDLSRYILQSSPDTTAGASLPVASNTGAASVARSSEDAEGPPTSVYMGEMVCCDQALAEKLLPWRGVRTKTHTYARTVDGPWVLYDNVADPYQLNNLAHDPASLALRARLEETLQSWMTRLDDPLVPAGALLERLGLLEAWREREDHFHPLPHPARHPAVL